MSDSESPMIVDEMLYQVEQVILLDDWEHCELEVSGRSLSRPNMTGTRGYAKIKIDAAKQLGICKGYAFRGQSIHDDQGEWVRTQYQFNRVATDQARKLAHKLQTSVTRNRIAEHHRSNRNKEN